MELTACSDEIRHRLEQKWQWQLSSQKQAQSVVSLRTATIANYRANAAFKVFV